MDYFDETLKDWIRIQQAGLGVARASQEVMSKRNKKILSMIGFNVGPVSVESITRRIKELDIKTRKEFFNLMEDDLVSVVASTVKNEALNVELLGIELSAGTMSTAGFIKSSLDTPMVGTDLTVRQVMNGVFADSTESAQNIVRRALTEGKTGAQVRSGLKVRFNVDNRHLETAVSTAINSVANTARDGFYKDNSDVISHVLWRSTLDSRTSSICQSLDGQAWKVNDPHPSPPAHPNCRSFLVPVVKGVSIKETRLLTRPAVANGKAKRQKVSTYGEWLGRQNKKFQEQILGKRRTEIFRDGKLSFDRFFTKDGRQLTIPQLEHKL